MINELRKLDYNKANTVSLILQELILSIDLKLLFNLIRIGNIFFMVINLIFSLHLYPNRSLVV